MLKRFFVSLLAGLVIGAGLGLWLGWGPLAVVYTDNPADRLDTQYREEYTVMVAAGFIADGDALGAVERLRILGVPNVPEYVQNLTEQFITNSRDVEDIRRLVALSEGFNRLTDIMKPYRIATRETP